MASNRLPAMRVLEARVIRSLVNEQIEALSAVLPNSATSPNKTVIASVAAVPQRPAASRVMPPTLERPVFIISAPRAGSTLLFETLACTPQLWTVGGEAHWLVEGFDHLAPGVSGVQDNRIDASWATPEVAVELKRRLTERLRGPSGESVPSDTGALRILEKTPKNALRIPFFAEIFPDARFVFLWRDPRENISSIIEAWRSGGWVTYSGMPEWEGNWSLLLPPGWQALRGKSLAEIAAFQWETTNRFALDDLARLARNQWMSINYDEFLADTSGSIRQICSFAGIDLDEALRARTSARLPASRHTLTAPEPRKWLKNEDVIAPQLSSLTGTWERLIALKKSPS